MLLVVFAAVAAMSACSADGASGGADATGAGPASGGSGGIDMTISSSSSTAASTGGTGGAGGAGGDPYPLGEPDCHPHEASSVRGAYFRKVAAEPRADALAIHFVATLPRIEIDLGRWFTPPEPGLAWQTGPLDRPSFYVGGRASGVEVDAGLTWDRVYHVDGRPTFTDTLASGSDEGQPAHRFVVEANGNVVSVAGQLRPEGLRGLVENFAFRPFWRAEGEWNNPPVGSPQNVYFYTGETIRAQIKASAPQTLELVINQDGGDKTFSVEMTVSGWGVGAAQSFKRVTSIDQFTVIDGVRVGLETAGLDVLPTQTRLLDAHFHEVTIRGAASAVLFPLDCDRPAVIGADALFQTSYDQIFRLFDQDASGAERIDIVPSDG